MLSTALATDLGVPNTDGAYAMNATDGPENPSSNRSSSGNDTEEEIILHFFYGSGCSHCAMVEPYVEGLAKKYPQVVLKKYEIFYNSSNLALYYSFNERFDVKDPVVPSVFIGDEALIGDEIKAELEPTIQRIISSSIVPSPPKDNSTEDAPRPPADNSTEAGGDTPSTKLTMTMVVVAALADSINPCAISVMVFLLIFLTGLGDRRKVLLIGTVYIATVYLVYFLAGVGALTFLQSTTMTRYVYYVAAALSIAFGLINIKDYFFFGKGLSLAIPESRKPVIKKYIEKASVPAAIMLGFAVSLFELPCTGGIYLAILSLLSNSMTAAEGIPYLALYNAIFVLPLAVILLIFFKGVTAEKVNSWRLEKRRTLKLALGLVMLLLGVVMVLEVL